MSPQPPGDPLAEDLARLACRVANLDTISRGKLQGAVSSAERALALHDLATLLRSGCTSKWALAGEISQRLRRFEHTGYQRIAAGARMPVGTLERAMAAVLADATGALSQRRIFDTLRQ